ncbi:F0F1 ATP synthase subunit delta [Segnochrobactraceae bacterium EtOH-i3]
MTIDWWTLALQAINVLILLAILARFLFRPVAGIIAARQEAAAAMLDRARAAETAAEAERDRARAEADAQTAARAAALAAAEKDAAARSDALLAAAEAEIARARQAADADVARARAEARTADTAKAGELALAIAARLFTRLPDDARVAGFLPGLAEAVAGLPEAARAGIGADGTAVTLTAPRTLTDAETAALTSSLAGVLDRPVTLAVQVDPDLIAGLEITTAHAIVRNSLRADLARIAEEMTRHG